MSLRIPLRPVVFAAALAVSFAGVAMPSFAATGDDTSFALAAGATPFGSVLGPDNNIWVTTGAANSIAKVDAKGTITNYPIPTAASNPRFITVGSDRNLWFTESAGNKIGRITTAGVITEFAVPTAAAEPFVISPGPDGNLWFTELAGNKIGRITTAGVITEFAVPTAASAPYGIVAGPTGSNDMYFTESAGDKIGKITSSGVITEIPLAAGSKPHGITTVASTLWIAEFGTNKVAQLQGNTVLEISMAAGSQPIWVTQGPGPTMWVSLNGTAQMAVLTAAGALQATFALEAGTKPAVASQGSDGNMWVAETGTGKIARVLSGQTPMLVTAPAITPTTAAVGATLTTSNGVWAYEPTAYVYSWQSCTTSASTTCTAIASAAAATYVVTAADTGKFISAKVAATNLNGTVAPSVTNIVQVGGTATPSVTPAPTPSPSATTAAKPVSTMVTVNANAKVKRGKATVITIALSPTTAVGVVNVTYKGGKTKSVVKGLKPINGALTTVWTAPTTWPLGKTRITVRFFPTAPTVNLRGSGFDVIRVVK
jgi:streptogramin lyase